MRAVSPLLTLSLVLALGACAPTVSSYSTTKPQQRQNVPGQPASTAEGTRVALLLPLSGAQASLGQSLLNAAQLAVYDAGDDKFTLLPQDTQGTPAGAAEAVRRALTNGAQLLIGPVFTPEVEAANQATVGYNVNTLALTNNETLADRDTYILGLSPDDQVTHVLQYAQQQGLTRVAALLPNNSYGDALADAFSSAASQLGLTVVRTDRYVAGGDAGLTAQGFAAALAQAGGTQALLLGESGTALPALATALQAQGVNARLLSASPVDDGLITQNATALQGLWYAAPAGTQRRAFTARYEQTYGSKPAAISSLAYDATALAAVLARKPGAFSATNLQDPMGFGGVDGIFRLGPNGRVERGLAIFEASAQGAFVADAAPLSFSTATH